MENESNDRRNFLGKLVLGTTALAAAPILGASPLHNTKQPMNSIKKIMCFSLSSALHWYCLPLAGYCNTHGYAVFPDDDEIEKRINLYLAIR